MSLVEVLSDERICRRVFSYLLMTTRLHVADQLCCCPEDHQRISPVELHLLSSRLLQWTYQYDMTFHNSRGMSNDWYTISFSHLGPMDMPSIMFSHRLLAPRESIWKPIRKWCLFLRRRYFAPTYAQWQPSGFTLFICHKSLESLEVFQLA